MNYQKEFLFFQSLKIQDAEKAGLLANDIITSINDRIFESADFKSLSPGDIANVSVLRDGQPLDFSLEVMPAPDDPERGLIGIMRDNSFALQTCNEFY